MPHAPEAATIVYRDIVDVAEMRAVEDLQIEAWGDDERDIVPLNQLVAARHVGGTVIGAFDRDKLAGFVYGFYGHIRGRTMHHSHMLAVLPAYRNHNLAYQLKLEQRERVLADGFADRITWTFDPLQSLNAHFNFAKLGVLSDSYKVNVYGDQGTSFLHQNGTDRLFVTWLIGSPRVTALVEGKRTAREDRIAAARTALRLLRNSNFGGPEIEVNIQDAASAPFVAIEIPADINAIERTDFDTARKWREQTRQIFSQALSDSFVVVDYFRTNEQTGSYLLEKTRLDDGGS